MANNAIIQKTYIHYRKINYLNYKNNHINLNLNYEEIRKIYQKYANNPSIAKGLNQLKQMKNMEGDSLLKALGVENDLAGKSEIFSQMGNELSNEISNKIKNLIGKEIRDLTAILKSDDFNKSLSQLDHFVSVVKDIDNNLSNLDKNVVSYLLKKDKTGANISTLFREGRVVGVNQIALTSLKNIEGKIKALETSILESRSSGKIQSVHFNNKTYTYSSLVYSLKTGFLNVLGGVGEGVAIAQVNKILEEWAKKFQDSNVKVELKATGTGKNDNKSVNKSDYKIQIMNGDVNFEFGVSVKNQLKNSGKSTKTFFHNTSNLASLLNKLTNIQKKYVFYNSVAHNVNDKSMQFIRRQIAADNALNAVAGFGSKENILFLQYADEIITIQEFFNELANRVPNALMLNLEGQSDIKKIDNFVKNPKHNKSNEKILKEKNYVDPTPNKKNTFAYQRSKETLSIINNLNAKITYTY